MYTKVPPMDNGDEELKYSMEQSLKILGDNLKGFKKEEEKAKDPPLPGDTDDESDKVIEKG